MHDTHHAPSFAQPTVLNILAPCSQLALPEEDSGNPSRNVVFFQKNQPVYSENVLVIMCDSRQESPKLLLFNRFFNSVIIMGWKQKPDKTWIFKDAQNRELKSQYVHNMKSPFPDTLQLWKNTKHYY